MRSLVNWKDMVCEFPNRFAQTVEGDKVTLQRSPGTVRTQGTPQNATNFNTMDLAALEAMLMSSFKSVPSISITITFILSSVF